MSLRTFAGLILAVSVISPLRAEQADPQISYYARCTIAFSSLTGGDDPALKPAGVMGTMFYAAQIFGADPDIDLTNLLVSEAKIVATNGKLLGELGKQCGADMQRRGKQISEAGAAIKQLATELPQNEKQ